MRIQHLLVLAIAAGGPLQAQAIELNEQFALAITPGLYSDYRNSGISQTLGDPAAQLDLMLSHASGLYAGVWTSNVNFGYDWENDDRLGTRRPRAFQGRYCYLPPLRLPVSPCARHGSNRCAERAGRSRRQPGARQRRCAALGRAGSHGAAPTASGQLA